MRKTVSAMRARGKLGQILEEVYYRGDQYIIERAGKPMAAVVPIEQFEQLLRAREEYVRRIAELRDRNAAVPPEIVERDVELAKRAVRKHR